MTHLGKIGTVPIFLLALCASAWAQPVVNVYSSMAEKDVRRLVAEFERRHGVKVNLWRSGKNRILERVLREARGRRYEVDVIHNPAPEMEALHNEKLLRRMESPRLAELIPQAVPAHREWAGPRVYIFVQAYNTRVVDKAELPKTYRDLLAPRWKGRVAIEGKEQEWFYTLVQAMGEAPGLQFFRELAANGLQVRMGNALLTNLVVAGDVPFALTLYSYLPEQQRRAGAPIDWIALAPTIAATDAVGVAAHAPHRREAELFYDFMLGDGQRLMADMGHITSDRRTARELERYQLKFIDPAAVIRDYDRWTRIFEDTIHNRQ
jgi:iron(III) transport system substrate-binding protein